MQEQYLPEFKHRLQSSKFRVKYVNFSGLTHDQILEYLFENDEFRKIQSRVTLKKNKCFKQVIPRNSNDFKGLGEI